MKKQFFFLLSAVCLMLTSCENYTSHSNQPANQPNRGAAEQGRRDQPQNPANQQPGGPTHQEPRGPQQGR